MRFPDWIENLGSDGSRAVLFRYAETMRARIVSANWPICRRGALVHREPADQGPQTLRITRGLAARHSIRHVCARGARPHGTPVTRQLGRLWSLSFCVAPSRASQARIGQSVREATRGSATPSDARRAIWRAWRGNSTHGSLTFCAPVRCTLKCRALRALLLAMGKNPAVLADNFSRRARPRRSRRRGVAEPPVCLGGGFFAENHAFPPSRRRAPVGRPATQDSHWASHDPRTVLTTRCRRSLVRRRPKGLRALVPSSL
jgi:hypothetical protein